MFVALRTLLKMSFFTGSKSFTLNLNFFTEAAVLARTKCRKTSENIAKSNNLCRKMQIN